MNCVDVTFVVLEQHIKEYAINAAINKFFLDAKIVTVPEVLPGAVCTCLKGIENIGDNLPVIFNDCDHMFSCKALANRLAEVRPIDFGGALARFRRLFIPSIRISLLTSLSSSMTILTLRLT